MACATRSTRASASGDGRNVAEASRPTLRTTTQRAGKRPSCAAGRHNLLKSDLPERIRSEGAAAPEPAIIRCGHDVIEILALELRRLIGRKSATETSAERLELDLSLAYEAAFF